MKEYTFITELVGTPHYCINQFESSSLENAEYKWAKEINLPYIRDRRIMILKELIKRDALSPSKIQRTKGVYFVDCFLHGRYIMCNIFISSTNNIIKYELYSFICFLEGGTYIRQFKAKNEIEAISKWYKCILHSSKIPIKIKEYTRIIEREKMKPSKIEGLKNVFGISINNFMIFIINH